MTKLSGTKLFALTAAALMATSTAAFAGDAQAGAKEFNKCKSCHMIASADETIVKGGKTGPNLYGVVGRPVASFDGFKYGDGILAVGATGMVWDEASLIEYVADPTAYIDTHGGSGRSKMTFKLKDGSNVVAYLATFSTMSDEGASDEGAEATETMDDDMDETKGQEHNQEGEHNQAGGSN